MVKAIVPGRERVVLKGNKKIFQLLFIHFTSFNNHDWLEILNRTPAICP